MPSPHNFIILEDFFPLKYSKLFLTQQTQPLFLLTLIFNNSLIQTSKNKSFFSKFLPKIIFIASFAWIEDIKFVIVFNTPAVSQVSNCAASFKKHFKQEVFF